jgi:hypothetical protein
MGRREQELYATEGRLLHDQKLHPSKEQLLDFPSNLARVPLLLFCSSKAAFLLSLVAAAALSEIHPLSAVRHGSAHGRMRRRSIEAPSAALLLVHQRQKLFIALSSGAAPTRCRPAAFITSSFKDTVAPDSDSMSRIAINSGEIGHGCYYFRKFPRSHRVLFVLRAQQAWGAFVFLCASTPFWNEFKSLLI